MRNRTLLFAAFVAALAPLHVQAGDAGGFEFKFGAHHVSPRSNNGALADGAFDVDVASEVRPTFNLGYWLTDNLQLDLLAALPFDHDVKLNGTKAASFTHLPPTLTLQYHFAPEGKVDPFLGLGVNYTWTYSEDTTGPLDGTRLALGNSFGLAAQAGLTVKINERWRVGADLRWMDIDSDAKVNGADVGTVHVDPTCVGVFLVYTF